MSQWPPKWAHTGGAFHDPIPFTDDFSVVHASEGRIARIGNESLSIPGEWVPLHKADLTWESALSWLSIDDMQYALDLDGEWYNEVVRCDIIAEDDSENSSSAAKKKTHVQSKTLVGLVFTTCPYNCWYCSWFSTAPTLCFLEGCTLSKLFGGNDLLGWLGWFLWGPTLSRLCSTGQCDNC